MDELKFSDELKACNITRWTLWMLVGLAIGVIVAECLFKYIEITVPIRIAWWVFLCLIVLCLTALEIFHIRAMKEVLRLAMQLKFALHKDKSEQSKGDRVTAHKSTNAECNVSISCRSSEA